MPSADEDELQSLADDIRAHGLLDPIVLFERRILDGRNRAAACESAGLTPRYVEFEGTREEALMFVVSHNLKRRHLTKQAIADTLVEAEDFNLDYELGEPAARSDIKMSAQKPKTASSRELAKAAGGVVSREMINATRKVKEKAEPELREAVKRGRIGVQDAAKVADLPPDQQKAIAASPKPRRAANVAIEAATRRRAPKGTRRTRALPFARLGKKRLPCVAYGKRPTTERGNGFWRQSGWILIRAATGSGLRKRPARRKKVRASRAGHCASRLGPWSLGGHLRS